MTVETRNSTRKKRPRNPQEQPEVRTERKKIPAENGGRRPSMAKKPAKKPNFEAKPMKRTPTNVEVSKIQFMKWQISPITLAASSPDGEFMVVVRNCGNLELRQKNVGWSSTFVVRWNVHEETSAYSAIAFDSSGKYLVTGRLNGMLDIYSVSCQGIGHIVSVDSGGGAIFAVATRPNGPFEVAVGCEDGRVRFLSIDEQFLENGPLETEAPILSHDPAHFIIDRGLRMAGMCLSLSWKSSDTEAGLVVCGDSNGGLRWIKGDTKEVIGRGKIPSLEAERRIWTVEIVAQGRHVVCGDSHGNISTWCSKSFTKLEENRIEMLTGDIWTSTVIEEPNGVEHVMLGCASGTVGCLTSLISDNGNVSWIPKRGRVVHSHDVKSMGALSGVGFFTASSDSRLCIFDHPFPNVEKHGTFVFPHQGADQPAPYQFLPELNLAVVRDGYELHLWRLGSKSTELPLFLFRLKRPVEFGRILSHAMSLDGTMLAASSSASFAMYKLGFDRSMEKDNPTELQDVEQVAVPLRTENAMAGAEQLCSFGDAFLGLSTDRQTIVCSDGTCTTKENLGSKAAFITGIVPSAVTKCVAVSDSLGSVFVGKHCGSKFSFRQLFSLGEEKGVACMKFSRTGRTLAASLWNSSVCVISLAEEKPRIGLTKPFPSLPTSISFAPSEKCLLVSGARFSYLTSYGKIRAPAPGNVYTPLPKAIDVIYSAKPVVFEERVYPRQTILASTMSYSGRIHLIMRTWESELNQLPKALTRKIYGT